MAKSVSIALSGAIAVKVNAGIVGGMNNGLGSVGDDVLNGVFGSAVDVALLVGLVKTVGIEVTVSCWLVQETNAMTRSKLEITFFTALTRYKPDKLATGKK